MTARRPGRTPAIAGLGMTDLGKVFGRSAEELAAEAVRRAVADAGMAMGQVDGLLVSAGLRGKVGLTLATSLGFRDLRLLAQVNSFGASAIAMVDMAVAAIRAGEVRSVVCVFADTPLQEGRRSGEGYARRARGYASWSGLNAVSGLDSVNRMYALAARRHMERYGTTVEQLGAVAVAQRAWAAGSPVAQYTDPIDLEAHATSRMIADPLRLLDCCVVSNGAIAVVVTDGDIAVDGPRPALPVLAAAASHPGHAMRADARFGLETGAARSGPAALRQAGVSVEDIDVVQLYDCYTYTVLVTLEDYGFCPKGEGGRFVAEEGRLGPTGSLKLNTGGGQLSGYYMWGMTPLSEAIIQLRGDGGARQVDDARLALVSGNGGVLDHHATMVLGVSG